MAASETLPAEVIGEPPVEMPVPAETLITVPVPAGLSQAASAPEPCVFRYWPFVPGGIATQPTLLRTSTEPRALAAAASRYCVSVVPLGAPLPPLTFASR